MKARIITTIYKDRQIITETEELVFMPEKQNQETEVINLYPDIAYQTLGGFGGAVTDAAASVLGQMGDQEKDTILRDYFGREGMGYRLARTSIDSCDFSRAQYCAYHEDREGYLDEAVLEREAGDIIKYLLRIVAIREGDLEVMLTPWSPPEQLKTNQSRTGGGKLMKEGYERWAIYLCSYIKAYRKRGIPVTMLSIQNEPNAAQTWDSCLFTGQEEKEFLRDYLYPALQKEGLSDIRVFIWDHNKERVYERTREIIDGQTDSMVDGVAFHWYSGDHFEGVQLVREQYADKILLFSEGCIEYSRFDSDNQLENAQLYAHDMIGNFNAGMNLFLDWNIVLDQDGGPNYVNNLCEAPVMYDTGKGACVKKLSYAYLSHFCRYIMPGARRVAHTKFSSELDVLSVRNPDGSLAVVACSRKKAPQDVFFRLNGEILQYTIPPEAMITVLI